MKITVFIAILLILLVQHFQPAQAQTPESRYQTIEDLFESMLEDTEEGAEVSSWLEDLQKLNENPVELNKAGISDLMTIPFLNEITASAIISYREKYGGLFSVYELASVPGIGRDLAEKLVFFVTVNSNESVKKQDSISFRKKSHHELLTRGWQTFPLAAGYRSDGEKPAAYAGSPQTVYLRYRFEKPGILLAGLTADKDGGEALSFGQGKYGFDFYSGHCSFKINEILPQFIIGDFTARTGQGLVLWQGFSLGKSADIMQASRNMSQIKPYTSTDENNFFRGLSSVLHYRNLTLNLFVSRKKSDGNLSLDQDSSIVFTSLQASGYHRTKSETADRKSVRHSVAGVFINWHIRQVKFGGTALFEAFQYPFEPGDQLYEKFFFRGKVNFNLGSDYHWITGKTHLFGEVAVSRSGGIALIQGIEARLHDQLAFTCLFRHAGKTYHATWAGSFATDSRTNGETGWYAGIRILPAAGISLSAYADWTAWPWIKYQTASPAQASDYLIEAGFKINRKLSGYVRYRSRNRYEKTTLGSLRVNSPQKSENIRLHAKYDFRELFTLGSRIELCHHLQPEKETGILFSQDMTWTPRKLPVSATLSLSRFQTPTYTSRIYSYEKDLLYAFSTFSFFGNGFRGYFKLKYSVMKNLDAWIKTGYTIYPQQQTISSGTGEIAGQFKTEVKIQFRYRF